MDPDKQGAWLRKLDEECPYVNRGAIFGRRLTQKGATWVHRCDARESIDRATIRRHTINRHILSVRGEVYRGRKALALRRAVDRGGPRRFIGCRGSLVGCSAAG